jgi:hypothetical protein
VKAGARYLLHALEVLVVGIAGYLVGMYHTETKWSAYLDDVMTMQRLMWMHADLITLDELRLGKSDRAIEGIEMLITSGLTTLNLQRATTGELSQPVFTKIKGELESYNSKYPATAIDPARNEKLRDVLR